MHHDAVRLLFSKLRQALHSLFISLKKICETRNTTKMKLASAAVRRARIVLVGSGRMGQIRGSLMYSNPRFDMIGVCDVNEAGALSLGDKFSASSFKTLSHAIDHFGVQGQTQYFEQFDASGASMIVTESNHGDGTPIDGIVLCAPTFTHEDVICEAAEYGLPIFVEKPVDETAEKIENLFDICERYGAKLCCGFQRRFDDSYVAVTDAVRLGNIGKPISANIFFADHPCPPIEFLLTGGDIFMDLCVSFVLENLMNCLV